MGDFKEFKITWNLPKFSLCSISNNLNVKELRFER